ncbi:hypothetical protein MHYP_G00340640 [Metynnis hypsauchen]
MTPVGPVLLTCGGVGQKRSSWGLCLRPVVGRTEPSPSGKCIGAGCSVSEKLGRCLSLQKQQTFVREVGNAGLPGSGPSGREGEPSVCKSTAGHAHLGHLDHQAFISQPSDSASYTSKHCHSFTISHIHLHSNLQGLGFASTQRFPEPEWESGDAGPSAVEQLVRPTHPRHPVSRLGRIPLGNQTFVCCQPQLLLV